MCVGEVAYRLILPAKLVGVHNIFNVSMLRRYIVDPSHVLHHKLLVVQPDVTFVERLKKIIDTKEWVLRTVTIHWVKIQCEHHGP